MPNQLSAIIPSSKYHTFSAFLQHKFFHLLLPQITLSHSPQLTNLILLCFGIYRSFHVVRLLTKMKSSLVISDSTLSSLSFPSPSLSLYLPTLQYISSFKLLLFKIVPYQTFSLLFLPCLKNHLQTLYVIDSLLDISFSSLLLTDCVKLG